MAKLILATIDDRQCYTLDGQPLKNYDAIEIRFGDDWRRGHFLWNDNVNDRPVFETTGYGKSIAETDDVRRDTYVPQPVPEQFKPSSATLTDSERRAKD